MTERSRLRRFVELSSRFLTVGALSTLIEIASFNLLLYVAHVDGVWAKVIASLIALINAYFGNREWTFKGRGQHARSLELVLFLIVNGLCTALGAAIVWAGLAVFPEAGPVIVNLVNLVSIGIVVIVRFALYHYVVFKGVRPSATVPLDAPAPSE